MGFVKQIERAGRARIFQWVQWFISSPHIEPLEAGRQLACMKAPRILLIGIYPKMGQFLCATPLVRALKQAWPQATFHFLGSPFNGTVARANPHLDRVWVWKKWGLTTWWGQLRLLRKQSYDLALLIGTEKASSTGVLVARAIGARWVAGYVKKESASRESFYHIPIPFQNEKRETEKFLGLARAFGVASENRTLELSSSLEDESAADALISAHPILQNRPRVGLFIGGKSEREDRLWPIPHWVELAHHLKEKNIAVIAVCPPPPKGASTQTLFSEEHQRMEVFSRMLGWACPTVQEASVLRAAAFLKQVDLFVCPDGGMFHVSAAVGTPTLGLFFSTDPEVWRHDLPHQVIDGRQKSSKDLSPESVAEMIFQMLNIHELKR